MPRDARFRTMLRIYAAAETSVTVAFDDVVQTVDLRPGANILEPAYAQLSDVAGDVTLP